MMKPKVLLVIDQDKPKWCFYQIAWQIKKYLQFKFDFTIITQQDCVKNLNRLISEYDALLLFYWGTFQIFKNVKQKSKISIGIYDYLSWNYYKDLFEQVKDVHSFFTGNVELAHLISEKKNDAKIFICEDGVDTEMFKPKTFTIGWTGKSDWGKWYQDASFKGVELIRQAVDELDDVKLVIQDASVIQILHENMKSEFFDKIDCYICASKQEGTPNTVLEALSCGIPVISTNVGIVPKLENVDIIERNVESIKQAIMSVRTRKNERRQQIVENWDWSRKVLNFDILLCDMLGIPVIHNIVPEFRQKNIEKKPDAKKNLSSEVTVFIITIDRTTVNYKECIKHIEDQNSVFDIIVIEGIAPMDRAFNEMIKRCKTPYFIQVDDDMMLNRDAVFYLYDKIKNADPKTAIIASPLRDTHLQRTIMGIKIYNYEIIKNYPFTNSYSCEISQFQKFTQDGYKIITDWQPSNEFENSKFIGRHGENYTPFTAYERYYRLFRKQKMTGQMIWVEEWLQTFLSRYRQNKDKIDLFSFFGSVVGFLSEKPETGEKDFTKYNEIEGFNELFNKYEQIISDTTIPDLINDISSIVFNNEIEPEKYNDLLSHFGEPEELSLFMTSKCNLDCWYCKRSKTRLTYDMNVSTVKIAINRYPTIKSVCIAGLGEPLMCENFESIVSYLNSKNIATGLITNGLLLTEKKDILLKCKFNYISISIKDETISDPQIIEGIKFLTNQLFQNVGISYVVHKRNYRTIPEIIDYGTKHSAKFIHFQNILPYTTDFNNLVIRESDRDILDNIASFRKHDINGIVKLYPVPVSDNPPCGCKSVFKSISMNAEGFITPCRRVYEPSNRFSFIGLQNPFEHPSIIKLRRSIISGENLSEECKNCWGNWYE